MKDKTNIGSFTYRKRANIAFFILLCVYTQGIAQQNLYSISGKITDQSGTALPRATVHVVNTDQTILADLSGSYVLRLPYGKYIITTNYLGFNTHTDTVEITNRSVVLDVVLSEKIQTLETVEITANPHAISADEPLGFTLSGEKVTYEFIRENQGNNLMNTLEKLPGISALHTGVGISKPVIRGMSFNRVIVNEYGIKQEGQQWGVDHGLELDQYGVNEIEILKGPVSILYGSDGLAGVINIRQPKMPVVDTLKADALLSYKSNNSLFGTSASVETKKNNFWVKARATWQDFGDYKVPANEFQYNSFTLPIINRRLKNTAGEELDYALHLGYRQKWGHSTLYLSSYGQKVGFFSGAFGIPRSYQLQDDGNTRDIQLPYQNIDHWKVISNTVIYGNKSKWMVDLGYQHNLREEHSSPHAHGQGPVPEGTLALQLRLETLSYNIRWGYDIRPDWHLYIGSNGQLKNNRTAGFESLIPEYTLMQSGVYTLQDAKIREGLYWQLGLRWDIATQEASETNVPIYASDASIISYSQRNPTIEKQYSIPTISSGIAWELTRSLNLKYNIGTAFRFPSIPELASNGIHHGTFRHELGDPSLNIEKGVLQDISWEYDIKRFKAMLSPFYYHFGNYIYLRPSARFSTLPDAGQIYQYSEGRVHMGGLESSLQYAFLNNWEGTFSLEYVRNRNKDLGYPLPFTPPFHTLSELEYRFSFKNKPSNNWIRISWDQFAAQHRVDQNEDTTPGYSLLHLAYGMEFFLMKRTFQWRIQITNLTNTCYLNNMSRYRILNLPEQGRNIQVSLSFQ